MCLDLRILLLHNYDVDCGGKCYLTQFYNYMYVHCVDYVLFCCHTNRHDSACWHPRKFGIPPPPTPKILGNVESPKDIWYKNCLVRKHGTPISNLTLTLAL